MLPNNAFFLDHVRWLRRAAVAHGVEVLVELESMRAFLRRDGRFRVLLPQFLARDANRPRYVAAFTDEATHFAGWWPAFGNRWPASTDKLVFKRAAAALGLPVPEHALDDREELRDVVVKRSTGSFGLQVHGPYRSSRERALNVAEGEFYERFVDGELLKVWFTDDRPIGAEVDPMPTVVGDGRSTLRALAGARLAGVAPGRMDVVLDRVATVLAFDSFTLDDILPPGRRQRVEFRYGTDLMLRADRRILDLRGDTSDEWAALRAAAPLLHSLVPAAIPRPVQFVVDAVRDVSGRIVLLEMNSNPMVNPLAYDGLVSQFAADAGHAARPALAPASAAPAAVS